MELRAILAMMVLPRDELSDLARFLSRRCFFDHSDCLYGETTKSRVYRPGTKDGNVASVAEAPEDFKRLRANVFGAEEFEVARLRGWARKRGPIDRRDFVRKELDE